MNPDRTLKTSMTFFTSQNRLPKKNWG